MANISETIKKAVEGISGITVENNEFAITAYDGQYGKVYRFSLDKIIDFRIERGNDSVEIWLQTGKTTVKYFYKDFDEEWTVGHASIRSLEH